ncbi:MAG TPA: FkbM family methyltransferase [Candidatus Paceibacterota bacterium]|nr:FkbM family methyltransferase [Candidatus Paceibacterota bacterium]
MNTLIAAILRYRQFRHLGPMRPGDIARTSAEPELFLLGDLIDPNKAFFDVGANVGAYVYAASAHLPLSRIYAFEPQAQYVSQLKQLFPGAHIAQAALSSRAGEARFKVPTIRGREYPTRGTLEDFKEDGEEAAQVETVATLTLDEAKAAAHCGPVGCIKIDVEGHEKDVLLGAQKTLAEDRPALIVEIEQRHHTEPIEDIFAWILARGYEGSFWDRASQVLRPLSDFSAGHNQRPEDFKSPSYVNNFIFTPHG